MPGLCRILHEIKVDKAGNPIDSNQTDETVESVSKIVWTPIVVCGGLAEIDRNRVTILASDIEEIVEVDKPKTMERLEKAILEVEELGIIDEENQVHMEKVAEVKKARAILQADQFLSDGNN